jgi:predicted TIM-barrel fold metal-dependent hydrolase
MVKSGMSRIDFHVHITPPDISAAWQKYAEKEPYFALLCQSRQNKFASAEETAASLDASGFSRAVVFGFAFRDMGLCRYVNDYVIEKIQAFPGKLLGFMAVPPGDKNVEKEIDRCCSAGLIGAGELFPEGQGFDPGEPDDTARFSAACKERGIPVLLHINEPVGHYYPGKTDTSLRRIERFIENNPGLRIVLAHWGGGLFLYEAMPELREKFRDVYYDTAASPLLYDSRIYRAAAALGITEKILFGSDFPLLSWTRCVDALVSSGLSAEDQEGILGVNAERLLSESPSFCYSKKI